MNNLHKSKWQSMMIGLALITALLAACAPAPAAPVEAPPAAGATEAPAAPTGATKLVVWGFIWTADWLDTLKAGFEAAHPGVTVEVNRFEYDPYQDMVVTTLASGEGIPDVVTLDPMWTGDIIRSDSLLPLDKATTELNVADFVPGGWNMYAWQGKQYGVPLDLDFKILFYRKDVYDAAMKTLGMTAFPTNTDDFLKLAQEVTKETGKPAIEIENDYYTWYTGYLAPMGGNLIDDAGAQYIFNNDVAVQSLQLYSDLATKYKIAKLWTYDTDGDPTVGVKGESFMAIANGSWFISDLSSAAPDMAGKWAIAPLPWGSADRKYDAATGGACLSIPTKAAEPDLAWEFIKYAMTPEAQVEYYKIVGGVPSLKTSWGDAAFDEVNTYLNVPLGRNVADWSLRAMPMQLPSVEVADLITEAITKVTSGQATPKEALDEAVQLAPPLK
jgi:ABC-type glycerol-3-phosphate transport system substrate-binding protein